MIKINIINLKHVTDLIEKYEKIKIQTLQDDLLADESKVKFIGVVISDLEDLLK